MPSPSADDAPGMAAVAGRRRFLVAYALAILRDHAAAEDVAQEVLMVAAAKGSDLPAGDGLVPWLKVVTRHKALQELARRKRQRAVDPTVLAAYEQELDWQAEDDGTDTRAAMRRCLDKLGGDARAIVLGRYQDAATCEAIAERLGRTVQAVYAVLKRARAALADCLQRQRAVSET